MSYETPSQPRQQIVDPPPPSRPRTRTVRSQHPPDEPAWRVGKCLVCIGRGERTVYRCGKGGSYLPVVLECECCGGTGETGGNDAAGGVSRRGFR